MSFFSDSERDIIILQAKDFIRSQKRRELDMIYFTFAFIIRFFSRMFFNNKY